MKRLAARETTRFEDFAFLAALAWLLAGLCFDGWAHRHQQLETFFTPWHGVLYSGFAATCAVGAWLIVRRRPLVGSLREALPPGYAPIVVALTLFAVGGVGDAIWHTVFGIETSLDALLSPTHLLMLVSMQIAGASPLRAAWRRVGGDGPTFGEFLPVTLSLAFNVSGVAFFFLYVNGFNNWPMAQRYHPFGREFEPSLGVIATIVTTVFLFGAVMLLLHRWKLPFGAVTLLFAIPGVFLAGLDAFEFWWQILAPVAGGLTVDLVLRSSTGPGDRRAAWRCGLVGPLVMWSIAILATHVAWTVRWPAELWVGSIVMSSLAGLALAIVSHPPAIPRPTQPS